MKKVKVFLFSTLLISFFAIDANAQSGETVLGPYDVYVSKQEGTSSIFSGEQSAEADEGRVLDINITGIQGPITVDPTNFSLTGPPCPTYDIHGKRNPENPATPTSQDFSGSVTLDQDNFPEPGTMVEAQFTAKDDGYWTTCSKNKQNKFTDVVKVKFKIHSLKIKISPDASAVCEDVSADINVDESYPTSGNGATITWKSLNGRVRIVSSNDYTCRVAYASGGDGYIVATISAGTASYSDTVKVTALTTPQFSKSVYSYLLPATGKINLLALLPTIQQFQKYKWQYSLNGSEFEELTTPELDKSQYAARDNVLIKVQPDMGTPGVPDINECYATTTIRFHKFGLAIPNSSICDGAEMPFIVGLDPAADPATITSLLSDVSDFKVDYKLKYTFNGNKLGSADLNIQPIAADFSSKVDKMIWYSSQSDNCNDVGAFKIWVTAKQGGSTIKSEEYPIYASARGDCVNGKAWVTQEFRGYPEIDTCSDAMGKYWYFKGMGSFDRTIVATTSNICNANSQFRQQVENEEQYHKGQFEGSNGTYGSYMYSIANVLNPLINEKYRNIDGPTGYATAWKAFDASVAAERARSNSLMNYPPGTPNLRCAVEDEAKTAINAEYRSVMKCAYTSCGTMPALPPLPPALMGFQTCVKK